MRSYVNSRFGDQDWTLSYNIDDGTVVLEDDGDFRVFQASAREIGVLQVNVEPAVSIIVQFTIIEIKAQLWIGGGTISRDSVLTFLYQMAEEHQFFFVRGTPAAGKTTLCYQLFNHLQNIRPGDRVSCDLQDDPLCVEDSSVAHWLLFDDAQTSYDDEVLWAVFLKLIPGHYRVVMFASYGNQQLLGLEAVDIIGVPIVIPSISRSAFAQRRTVSQTPSTFLGYTSCRKSLLKSSRAERPPGVGTRHFYLGIRNIRWPHRSDRQHSYVIEAVAKTLGRVERIALADFFGYYSGPAEALVGCARGMSFMRGLPSEEMLKAPEYIVPVEYIRELLRSGAQTYQACEVPDAAWEAHECGWISFREERRRSSIVVDFPSLFHQSQLSYLLHGLQALPATVEVMDLNTFVKTVATPSIPEAQFQNEFYRAIYKVTNGGSGLWISPEFGTPQSSAHTGRIDFYLMGSKKWGIEILRNGDHLDEHVRQFGPGGPTTSG
ncbi:hypothetical protein B0H13DRAFT_2313974 [Mycena leptocephala]|nr:hypothetical protein B0H13DRAFT_2313974 [Mycena leptocephala]